MREEYAWKQAQLCSHQSSSHKATDKLMISCSKVSRSISTVLWHIRADLFYIKSGTQTAVQAELGNTFLNEQMIEPVKND
jgi:hypothetical protein